MKIIIAPTDFSKNGNNAVEYAGALAKEFNSKLIIAHVYIDVNNSAKEESETEHELKEEERQKLILLSERFSSEFHIDTEAHLLTGQSAADTIIKFAAKMQADLVVVGCTGTNLFERMIMGSTTAKLVRESDCPVMCIPSGVRFQPVKHITFATDLKEDNINAALSLATFAEHFNAELSFLFVDNKDLIHDDKSINEMTNRIRLRVHYPHLSGYITKHSDINKGIQNYLKQKETQVLAMYTYKNESYPGRFSKSITADMSDHSKIPLLSLKKNTVTLA